MNEPINLTDLNCLLSAIKALEEEGYSVPFLAPKKRLAGKMARMISDAAFEMIRTPKWLKRERDAMLKSRTEPKL